MQSHLVLFANTVTGLREINGPARQVDQHPVQKRICTGVSVLTSPYKSLGIYKRSFEQVAGMKT
jgi:hypothetical protein